MKEIYKEVVSVIIATYNSEKVLRRTLIALRSQTYPQDKIEILIVDGMSGDSTREIAAEYNCHIIDNPKVEQGNAKILGMKNAKGKYVLFVDSDEVLENLEAIQNTVTACNETPDCYFAVCSGYKKPVGYSGLSGYISDFGDPLSFFVYKCPKDYRFYESFIKRNYRIIKECKEYFVFDCNLNEKFVLIEGGCGGIMMDMSFFAEKIPDCKNSIAVLYHSFYEMCNLGNTKVIYIKEDPLAHYSSDKFSGYYKKLKWRVCNNIHFQEKSKEVYVGREKYYKGNQFKKYLFLPYGISVILPFIHSVPYAVSRKNAIYLLHCLFSFYVVMQIIYQYILKILHITPAFVAYGSSEKIDK